MVWPGGSESGKMVLTLLTEIVTLYIGPTAVDVHGLGLELVSRSNLRSLEERLEELIHVFLHVSGNVRSRGWWSLRGSSRSFRSNKSLGGSRFV